MTETFGAFTASVREREANGCVSQGEGGQWLRQSGRGRPMAASVREREANGCVSQGEGGQWLRQSGRGRPMAASVREREANGCVSQGEGGQWLRQSGRGRPMAASVREREANGCVSQGEGGQWLLISILICRLYPLRARVTDTTRPPRQINQLINIVNLQCLLTVTDAGGSDFSENKYTWGQIILHNVLTF